MTRPAKPHLDSFDPDVIEAARDVARRAGVPLEAWIAANLPPQGQGRRHRVRPANRHGHDAAAEAGRGGAGRAQADRGLDAVLARIEGLDQALDAERRAAQDAAARRLEEIEERIDRVLDAGAEPIRHVAERLGDIERRMSELGDKVAAAKPYGRRGRPAETDLREAVAEIRRRQSALGGAEAEPSVVASMHRDLARRLDAQGPAAGEAAAGETVRAAAAQTSAAIISELQREANSLRAAIGGLATSHDVSALEQAMISLANGVDRMQAPADLSEIAAPIDLLRVQVARLADDVSENVHARVMDDLRRISSRLETVAASQGGETPEGVALGSLFQELDEIRRLIGALAGPERVQSLVQGLHAISDQIAQLQKATSGEAGLTGQIRAMSEKLDALDARAGAVARDDSQAILGRIDALAHQVERASTARPVEALIGRLEDLGESLRRPAAGVDMASIQTLLTTLAEKVDRVGDRAGGDGLDALEQHVVTLARRLETRGSDPAIERLGHTMGDLLAQVTALREAAPDEAAVERAARNAVAASLGQSRGPDDRGEIGLLRAGLADLQARQSASDQRLGAMLDGVQSALDRLVARLGPVEAMPAAQAGPSLAEQLLASTAEAPRPVRRPEAPRPATVPPRAGDELLEPGAARPGREAPERAQAPVRPGQAQPLPEAGENAADIKASFIAAARRAAQAAQAELASETAGERRPGAARPGKTERAALAVGAGRVARLRAEIDRRRRPLLLGLAAIVLALGALQAIGTNPGREAPAPVAALPQAQPPVAAVPQASEKTAEKTSPKPPAAPEPQTTQAIPAPAKAGLPQVAGMSALAPDLGGLPAGLATLKQAALDGDGLAVWDLAAREAEGRGTPRDLGLAAKLYERLAAAGYAPAQYKIAGSYEKGSGVVRDIAQAKLWYGRAAEQGHARAMHNLAVVYAENPTASGKPDYTSAAAWFRQAAEYGVRDSQYNLAVLYARGLGLTQDLVQSYAWFAAAAAQGDEDAGKKRDEVAAKLSPADLATARGIAAAFKPRKTDPAANEPPPVQDASGGAVTLLGAPAPNLAPAGRKGV